MKPEEYEDKNRLEAKRIIRGLNKQERKHLNALRRKYAKTLPDDKRIEYLTRMELI